MEDSSNPNRRRKQLNVYVPALLHRATKVQALLDDMTISAYVEAALKERIWRCAMPRTDESFHAIIGDVDTV